MSLYPSLEDMMSTSASSAPTTQTTAAPSNPGSKAVTGVSATPLPSYPSLYPSLSDMGLDLSSSIIEEHLLAVAQLQSTTVAPVATASVVSVAPATGSMVAPVTGVNEVGMIRSEIKQGVRPIVLCKDASGRIGVALESISKGIFVAFVYDGSPAALAGLRFGDQILQINETTMAGFKASEANKVITKAAPERIALAIRDRPFERTVTMQKDNLDHVGFVFKKAMITAIVKDSSAARNGLLTDHYLVEVNGRNVVGMSDKDITAVFTMAPKTVTVTIMPNFLYEHLLKHIGSLKKYMDHSVPLI